MRITLVGDAALRRKLQDPRFVRGPVRLWLTRSAILLEGRAKQLTPVDTGRLRASITHKVEPFRAWVGTNVTYAPFVELGSRPHWPPLAAMQPWARRHGFPAGRQGAFLVARAIARRGTRARRMFGRAVEQTRNKIVHMWRRDVARDIEREWRK